MDFTDVQFTGFGGWSVLGQMAGRLGLPRLLSSVSVKQRAGCERHRRGGPRPSSGPAMRYSTPRTLNIRVGFDASSRTLQQRAFERIPAGARPIRLNALIVGHVAPIANAAAFSPKRDLSGVPPEGQDRVDRRRHQP